jgi:CDP-6-deoxy-D-xylo-4-hexulose-3-dehydrase
MGEGGGVAVNDGRFSCIALSIRDWGRDCRCLPGETNACGRRFKTKYGTLPNGYDHKYVYSNIGYNLKATDMQAAVGLAQMEKLEEFVRRRRDNFAFFYERLKPFEEMLLFARWQQKSKPSWFGFPVTVKKGTDPKELVRFLEDSGVETRKVFAGNILRQPGFKGIPHRVHGKLENTDIVMERTFFIGVYPGLTEEIREYVAGRFYAFFKAEQL